MATIVVLGGQWGDEGKGQDKTSDSGILRALSDGPSKANCPTFSVPMRSFAVVLRVVTMLAIPYMPMV